MIEVKDLSDDMLPGEEPSVIFSLNPGVEPEPAKGRLKDLCSDLGLVVDVRITDGGKLLATGSPEELVKMVYVIKAIEAAHLLRGGGR
jgi:hypothetical protein